MNALPEAGQFAVEVRGAEQHPQLERRASLLELVLPLALTR
jgi:hypothetical protein